MCGLSWQATPVAEAKAKAKAKSTEPINLVSVTVGYAVQVIRSIEVWTTRAAVHIIYQLEWVFAYPWGEVAALACESPGRSGVPLWCQVFTIGITYTRGASTEILRGKHQRSFEEFQAFHAQERRCGADRG